jgi:threonine synthase
MDILISSNFERFLYEMSGRDAKKIQAWYDSSNQGSFTVDPVTLKQCQETVYAGWADEEETLKAIAQSYQAYQYVFDPHTAVAMKVYEDYLSATNDQTYTVIASTASPFKFASSVLTGLEGEKQESWGDEWKALDYLSQLTGWKIPLGLQGLDKKPAKKFEVCEPEGIAGLLQKMFV